MDSIFSVSLNELKRAIGYKGNNHQHLKQMLEELVTTSIKWNIFDKVDGEIWGVSGLLSHCEIVSGSGMCHYSFSPGLQQRFLNPSMYIKLNLLISQKFSSKHSLALYCLALDYLDIKRNYSEKKFTVTELRQFLGLADDEYTRVVDLNKHIMKRAEAEINKTSDMNLEIVPIREAKQKITGFKFIMSIKKEQLSFYNTPQLKEPISQVKDTDNKENYSLSVRINLQNEKLVNFLVKNNISLVYIEDRLNEIANQIDTDKLEEYLLYLLDYTLSEISRGTQIKNIGGFYINLVKDNIQLQNYLYFLEDKNKRKEQLNKKVKSIYELIMS